MLLFSKLKQNNYNPFLFTEQARKSKKLQQHYCVHKMKLKYKFFFYKILLYKQGRKRF